MENKILYATKRTDQSEFIKTEAREPKPFAVLGFEIMGGQDVMPLGGWWGPYKPANKDMVDLSEEKYFQMLEDCGINMFAVCQDDYDKDPEQVEKVLTLADKYNMGMFINDHFIQFVENPTPEIIKERIDLYRNHKSCLGFHVKDEPLPVDLEFVKAIYDAYDKLGIKDQYLWIDLLPLFETKKFGTTEQDYYDYVDMFMGKVTSKFLVFNNYLFYFKNEGMANAKQFFKNLAIGKEICEKYNIPMWPFTQIGGQWQCVGKKSMELYPTEEEMRWNVNAILAFGSKSIQYFTVMQPEDFAKTDTDEYDFNRIGLIGCDGSKTAWYDMTKRINKWVQFIDEILMNSACCGIIPVGKNSEDIVPAEVKLDTYGDIIGVEGGEGIIGCFDYKGKNAYFIMNNTVTEDVEITCNFDTVRGFDVYVGDKIEKVCGDKLGFKLIAGEAVLVVEL